MATLSDGDPGGKRDNPALASPRGRGAQILFAGVMFAQVCALVRYVLLTRILGPEELGHAAILILTSQFLDLITEGGIAQYLILSNRGDRPETQATVQTVNMIRGWIMALAMFLLSGAIAGYFHAPRLKVGIELMAIAPLILGFLHFDARRVQRARIFGPEGYMQFASESLNLVVTLALAMWLQSFIAVAFGMAARSLGMVVVSHLMAQRRFRLGLSRDDLGPLQRFSGPLIANGALLFVSTQGDRLLVSDRLGVTALGIYSAILLLIYYPSGVLHKFMQSMHLPRVAQSRGDLAAFNLAVDRLSRQSMMLAALMMAGFAITVPLVVPILYGPAFKQEADIIALIGVMQSIRLLHVWPSTVALGIERSKQVLLANILRMLAFPIALMAMTTVGRLPGLVIGFAIGEFFAVILSIVIANRSMGRSQAADMFHLALFAACAISVALAAREAARGTEAIAMVFALLAFAGIGMILWMARELIAESIAYVRRPVMKLLRVRR